MNQIQCYYWLPKQARWRYLNCLGLPTVSHKNNFPESHIINPLLTKLVQSKWLGSGLNLLPQIYRPAQNMQKIIGQYPAILTEQAWSLAICMKIVGMLAIGLTYNTASNKLSQNSFSHQYGVPTEVFLLPVVLPN